MTRIGEFVVERDAWLSALLDRPALRLVAEVGGDAGLPAGAFFATAKVPAEDVAAAP